eukprot:6079067-Amphidinium_carterae.1
MYKDALLKQRIKPARTDPHRQALLSSLRFHQRKTVNTPLANILPGIYPICCNLRLELYFSLETVPNRTCSQTFTSPRTCNVAA